MQDERPYQAEDQLQLVVDNVRAVCNAERQQVRDVLLFQLSLTLNLTLTLNRNLTIIRNTVEARTLPWVSVATPRAVCNWSLFSPKIGFFSLII